MNTPIFDFVNKYVQDAPLRLHMPGHKGRGPLKIEQYDITEIDGADVLYHDSGIISESQNNASSLFGSAKTLYSTEGATLCIRAMLALMRYYANEQGEEPIIAACRNAHKSFVTACGLLNIDPIWISSSSGTLLSCKLDANEIDSFFAQQNKKPTALYLTSPDYLGNMMDIAAIAKACHKHGVLLIVDNAHGAYLHFLSDPSHPLDLGADLVCDSAHKTLPVLTGGAYLHISKKAPTILCDYADSALSIFASTSPSYLILQSLDLCNSYLNNDYKEKLYRFSARIVDFKKELRALGFQLIGDEPLKITVMTKPYGYYGTEIANLLKQNCLSVEFSDPDYVVLMLTPEFNEKMLKKILSAFSSIPQKAPILTFPPRISITEKVFSPREALFSASELLPTEDCEGRILAQPGVTCPPAIPVAICGEILTQEHLTAFRYYRIEKIAVVITTGRAGGLHKPP